MAAIEKICELSGDYPSYDMYRYKRNHIQIMPEHRKLFRGADHVLHIFKPEDMVEYKRIGGYSSLPHPDVLNYWEPPFETMDEYLVYFGRRRVKKYWFMLEVFDPELQGDVYGRYLNTTTCLSTMKRKMKRMLRCEKLNVVKHEEDMLDWAIKN
jgi:hypothetical protein